MKRLGMLLLAALLLAPLAGCERNSAGPGDTGAGTTNGTGGADDWGTDTPGEPDAGEDAGTGTAPY